MTRKVLISPGYGAGWSTWNYSDEQEQRDFMLFDEKLIAAIEQNGGKATQEALDDFRSRFMEKFGEDALPYMGGADDLTVATVDGQFRIEEYDGNESLRLRDATDWI